MCKQKMKKVKVKGEYENEYENEEAEDDEGYLYQKSCYTPKKSLKRKIHNFFSDGKKKY